jgi:hypothetical protein
MISASTRHRRCAHEHSTNQVASHLKYHTSIASLVEWKVIESRYRARTSKPLMKIKVSGRIPPPSITSPLLGATKPPTGKPALAIGLLRVRHHCSATNVEILLSLSQLIVCLIRSHQQSCRSRADLADHFPVWPRIHGGKQAGVSVNKARELHLHSLRECNRKLTAWMSEKQQHQAQRKARQSVQDMQHEGQHST